MNTTHINYQEYLESYAWKALKKTKLEEQPNCECCGTLATSVHHLSYERLGREKPEDIVSICERCHEECHHVGGYQIKNDEEILIRRFEEVRNQYLGNAFLTLEDGTRLKDLGRGILTNGEYLYCLLTYSDDPGMQPSDEEFSKFQQKKDQEEWLSGPENDGSYHPAYDGYLGLNYHQDSNLEGGNFNYPGPVINIGDEVSKSMILLKKDGTLYKTLLKEFEYKKIDDNLSVIGNNLYFQDNYLEKFDGTTFNILKDIKIIDNTKFIRFGNQVYYMHVIQEGLDGETFEILSNKYAKDINHIYFYGNGRVSILDEASVKTFTVLKYGYAKDINHVFHDNYIISGADSDSFEEIDYTFTKDKNNVYCHGVLLKGADPDTFDTVDQKYAKDKFHIYKYGKKIEGIDPETFKP